MPDRSLLPRLAGKIVPGSWILPGVALVSLMVASCAAQPAVKTADLGESVDLALGQDVSIGGEPLKVEFAAVISDSRCPTGATCIWQGEASCRLKITYKGTENTKIITEPGLRSQPATAEFADYEFQFQLQPYPQVGKEIDKTDYRLQLTVTRKLALSGGILVTFDVVGETYNIFVTNRQTIDEVYAVQQGRSKANIPNGRLVRGKVSYNEPWSWHIDPEDIEMVEMTIELSDGTPSQVEKDLDYWLGTVKRFSPWSAKLVKIEDFR